MADIIEHPTAYNMPCLIPEAVHVDRITEHGETIEWKGFRLTTYHFPGQTLFHGGLLVERDGFKLFMSGDSFGNWSIDDYCSENRNFLGSGVGFDKCLKLLLEIKPNVLMSAHWGNSATLKARMVPFSEDNARRVIATLEARRELYRKLFPYDDVNFGLDPFWIRAYPYRQTVLPGARMELEARIMNHSDKPKRAHARLALPEGWKAQQADGQQAQIPARTEGKIRLTAVAPSTPVRRRHVIGISTAVDGAPLGEFAEAIVEILG
jgi:hypothetical protein